MDRSINLGNIISIVTSDKQKLTARVITGATVLFLILAGTPFFNLNTYGVDAADNPYTSPSISNLANTGPTSSGTFIFWDTNISSNNRVYYGLNEADVNNLTNGSWSTWNNNTFNVSIRLSGLSANTTYYYKPESWNLDAVNNSVSPSLLMTLKPGVWTSPSEYMVSPPGWTGSPVNFRTVNISAAILNDNGRYITGLSLEAVIYNSTGGEIGRNNLGGSGPYSGSFILPDYLDEGGYVVRITNYPNVSGEFSVLRWGCANCHTNNYPSTFNPPTVHPKHFDTTQINVVHCSVDGCPPSGETATYTSTSQCGDCHELRYPTLTAPPQGFGVQHPQSGACTDCHKTPSGGNAALACEKCHGDITTGQAALSPRYGQDRHYTNATCNDCHGTLTSLTTKPNCTTCHPRPGSILNDTNITIPGSIENTSHSLSQTVSCGLCHNREHDVKSLQTLDATVCRTCHPAINHDAGNQCTTCHGGDPHQITFAGGDTCIECHGTNYTGANPMARTTLVDIYAFNESIHRNINNTPTDTLTNDDCWMCHYQKDMNRQNIRKCGDCHRKPNQWHGLANITTNWSLLW